MRDISIDLDFQTGCLQTVANSNLGFFLSRWWLTGQKAHNLDLGINTKGQSRVWKTSKEFYVP